ncbi:protein NDR1-like [Salvia miltiorrhiza]|uniref:protein NDR1-like n=1 Tax=Salvia miltiorrhiza TaxID=226208 RepID=UPI0025AD86D9|nr:protein NDR1-like [Salvia miltiorrhiza]
MADEPTETNHLAAETETRQRAGGDDWCSPLSNLSLIGGALIALATIVGFLIQQTFHLPGPRCYLEELYVPALDMSLPPPPPNSTANPFLFFVLGLHNNLQIRSISYGNVTLTFFYGRKAVAGYVVPGFYQGRMRTARRRDVVETGGVPWADALAEVSRGATAAFRVELAARPRFKILFWYSKEKDVRIVADVAVGGAGLKAGKDDIRLKKIQHSAAPEHRIRVLLLFIVTLLLTSYLLY